MMRTLLAAVLLLGAAPVTAAARHSAEVEITRDGATWTAEFHFTGRARAWMFARSEPAREDGRDWRMASWRVETPGVRLERRGQHDALVAVGGAAVPPRVRVAFTPAAIDLDGGYDPALVFTDGSVALYTGQFVTVPLPSAADVARLPRDLNGIDLPDVATQLRFRDASGPVLYAGRRVAVATRGGRDDDGTYVLFGALQPIVTDTMAEVLDPALPAWIRATLEREVPDILGRYAAVLGPAPGAKPTVLVSWGGATPHRVSLGGSVLPSLVTLAYEGEGLVNETPRARFYGLWFIAHESAHFWLGNAVHYEFARESWITEGGAELLAFRTVAAVDLGYDWRAAIDTSIGECVGASTNRGIADAGDRGDSHAYYACGAVFALVAEAASRQPFIRFVKRLIDENRADGIVSRADWLAALDRVSNDPSLGRDIGVLLDRGSADPRAAIASLFRRAGVAFTIGPDGVPRVS
jgi:hypothetical protein